MENEKSTTQGTYRFYLEKNRICLDFTQYNGLHKGEEQIEDFIKQLRKEVVKFKKWKAYKDAMEQTQLIIETGL